jgi:hypothetical protein
VREGEKRIIEQSRRGAFAFFYFMSASFLNFFFGLNGGRLGFYLFLGLNKPGLNFTLGKLHFQLCFLLP